MSPVKRPPDPHVPDQALDVTCYVCDTDLSGLAAEKHKYDNFKQAGKLGLVEINSEGTGFAGGGKNMAKKQGLAFQC